MFLQKSPRSGENFLGVFFRREAAKIFLGCFFYIFKKSNKKTLIRTEITEPRSFPVIEVRMHQNE